MSWARPVVADLLGGVWSVVVASAGVLLGFSLVGLEVRHPWWMVAVLAATFITLDVVVGPLLRRLASIGSFFTALGLGLVVQVALLAGVLASATGQAPDGADLAVVLFVAGAFLSFGRWLLGATDSGYVVGSAISHTNSWRVRRRRAATPPRERGRGLLVVQLDGVSREVLERALQGGQAPNLARWLRSSHHLDQWWSTVPSTTPAAMAGFLHGDEGQVPAFRWWDRDAGKLLVLSSPKDAALVESRFAPGDGLLRDGGTAIGASFSGEAARTYLTVSRAHEQRGLGPGGSYVSFFARPFSIPGVLVLTVGEMLKEVWQARRQRVRGVYPRIARRPSFVGARALTNVLLRKVNLSLVAQAMAAGSPVIFTDFVDYDEIAHHAGPERPEAMRALEGLDAVLGHLQQVARQVETEYELVIVSDHGQSLGPTFEQLHGVSFSDHISSLMESSPTERVEASDGEEFGPVNTLLHSVLGRFAVRHGDELMLGPDRVTARVNKLTKDIPELAVTGGGNLGMAWFPQLVERPRLGEVVKRWPRLVPGLLETAGVGLVMVTADDGTPVVLSRDGAYALPGGVVDGKNPLAGYPERTAADLAALHANPRSGDLVVISTVDENGWIHAFEHQVGSHGGVGGPQNDGLLIHPRSWKVDSERTTTVAGRRILVGPASVHDQLVDWRRGIGALQDHEEGNECA